MLQMIFHRCICVQDFRIMRDFLRGSEWDLPVPVKSYWLHKLTQKNIWYTLEYNTNSDIIQLECFQEGDIGPEAIILEIKGIQEIFIALDELDQFPEDYN